MIIPLLFLVAIVLSVALGNPAPDMGAYEVVSAWAFLIPLAAAAGGALLGGTGALGNKGGWGDALKGGLLGGSLGFGGAGLAGAGAGGAGAGLLAPTTAAGGGAVAGGGLGSALGSGISAGGGAGLLGGLGGASSVGAANAGGLMNALGPGMKAFNALQGLGGQQGQPQMLSTPPLQHITQNSPYMNLMPPQFQQPQQSLQVPTSYVPYG